MSRHGNPSSSRIVPGSSRRPPSCSISAVATVVHRGPSTALRQGRQDRCGEAGLLRTNRHSEVGVRLRVWASNGNRRTLMPRIRCCWDAGGNKRSGGSSSTMLPTNSRSVQRPTDYPAFFSSRCRSQRRSRTGSISTSGPTIRILRSIDCSRSALQGSTLDRVSSRGSFSPIQKETSSACSASVQRIEGSAGTLAITWQTAPDRR
jgi:hypothetical protein